jgi:hypothetical protein
MYDWQQTEQQSSLGCKLADALPFARTAIVNKGADHDLNILFTHPAQLPSKVSGNGCR